MPMPGSPTSSTRCPTPLRAAASSGRSVPSSASRPTMGRRSVWVRSCAPSCTGPRKDACTGAAFPFTKKGSSSVRANVVRECDSTSGEATMVPGSARAIRRAARFTVSPMTVYVRRYWGPMSPANTLPRFTPMRTGNGSGVSMMRRSASSMRSSSSPWAFGAPPDRISFPPSLSTSVPRKQRSRSSTASWVMRTSVSSASTASMP